MIPRKLHPLHTPEFLHQQTLETGCYADTTRCTGRTTAIALRAIAEAIDNPHKSIHYRDHHLTNAADMHLGMRIEDICKALRLEHMQIRPKQGTLTFERSPGKSQHTAQYFMYRDRSRV